MSVTGVKIAPSPEWMQKRLRAAGLNPINNVVDITNFVLHELGQPLHAFDADRLAGRRIIVKNMPAGTRFTTLDGVDHELLSDDLMICDAVHPVALAGIFGGMESGITDDTVNVFIESAWFNPVSVRRSARRLGISTDSSFRFERGVDPTITIYALKRAALLMKELAGGKIASEIVDVMPEPFHPAEIEISYRNIDRLTGKKIDHELIKKILNNLEFEIRKEDAQELTVAAPLYRVDVTREADVIEEILRIYGYNNIEISEEVHGSISYTGKPDPEKLVNTISDYLSDNGFNEIICNSLTRESYYENLKSFYPDRLVRILNPLSADLNVMRQTLLFGGLETIVHNVNRKNPDLVLYEFGTCYFYNHRENVSEPLDNYSEYKHLALFMTGRKHEPHWTKKEDKLTFFHLKAYVDNVFKRLGIEPEELLSGKPENTTDIFRDELAYTMQNHAMAEMGVVGRNVLNMFDIKADVFYANIYWDRIVKKLKEHKIQFKELPKYPEVKRDLSMILDRTVTFDQIRKLAFKTESKLLTSVSLFDIYEGDAIEKGKKSYAVTFVLQDLRKTLTDSEIDKVMERLMTAYEKELKAKIRR